MTALSTATPAGHAGLRRSEDAQHGFGWLAPPVALLFVLLLPRSTWLKNIKNADHDPPRDLPRAELVHVAQHEGRRPLLAAPTPPAVMLIRPRCSSVSVPLPPS